MHTLYFVRHGESEDNASKRWSRPASPLTNKGREQMLATAQKIKDQGLRVDLIITSTLPRAQESAQIVARTIDYPEKNIIATDILNERLWGSLVGKPNPQFLIDATLLDQVDNAPGAEKLADLQKRAARALRMLEKRPESNILIVGHGTFGRALRRVIGHEPPTNEYLPQNVRYTNAEIARLI